MVANNTKSIAGRILEKKLHRRCEKMSSLEIENEFIDILNDSRTHISNKAISKWTYEIKKGNKMSKIFLLNNLILGFEGLKI